jgi:hypothetical protein
MICISLCLATTEIFTIKNEIIHTINSYKSAQSSKHTHVSNNLKILMHKLDRLEKAKELYNQKNNNKNNKIRSTII